MSKFIDFTYYQEMNLNEADDTTACVTEFPLTPTLCLVVLFLPGTHVVSFYIGVVLKRSMMKT